MRLLLVRHGETVDNVACIYAGIRDSALTAHGVLQASRLASHLANIVKISHIFSSDLQRAFKTAEAIRLAQYLAPLETIKLELLREQDFGFYEGRSYLDRQKRDDKGGKNVHANEEGFRDVESKESMKARVDAFINLHLVEHLRSRADGETVVVVAHGIILSYLWRSILGLFEPGNITLSSAVILRDGRGLEYLGGGWSNTGYLDLEVKHIATAHPTTTGPEPSEEINGNSGAAVDLPIPAGFTVDSTKAPTPAVSNVSYHAIPITSSSSPQPVSGPTSNSIPSSSKLLNMSLVVKAVNCQEHLQGLKKTRGGIGSAKHDDKQQTVDSFYKKRRVE